MTRVLPLTKISVALLVGSLAISGCARQISPDVHAGITAGDTLRTYEATIEQARLVEIQESDTLEGNKTGQLLGGIAGGVAATRFGDGAGRALAVLGGAIVGSFLGALTEQEIKRQPAVEYIVRTDTGALLTVVQGVEPRMLPGQRVYVQEGYSGRGRIIPAV